MKTNKILIKNGTILTFNEKKQYLKNHSILIAGDKIVKIAPNSELMNSHEQEEKNVRVIDAKNRIVMPGLINTHMHFYSTFARGLTKAKPSTNFSEVLNNLWWRLDRKLTKEDCYYSTMVAMIDGIKQGTTTYFDHHASPYAIEGSLAEIGRAAKDCGVRVSLCYELSDRDGEVISQKGVTENIETLLWLKKEKSDFLKAMFGIHASFTVSDQTLSQIQKVVSQKLQCNLEDIGVHIHLAEDAVDELQCHREYNKSVVKRLNDHGLLGPKTITAHGVHLEEEEMEILASTKTILVHNPQSNMNNSVGIANIMKILDKGVLVGLGTDAMTVNMLEELRFCLWAQKYYQKDPSGCFMESVNLLLKNNPIIAKRFWSEGAIGTLEEGGRADLIIRDYLPPTPIGEDNFMGHLVFGISQSKVDTTIVGGNILMSEGCLTSALDEEAIYAKSSELAQNLWSRF